MAIIPIEDLEVGMKLAADIKNHLGQVLLGAGREITEKGLKVLKAWGITEADIEGLGKEKAPGQEATRMDPALIREAEARLREQFRRTNLEHPFVQELFRLATLRMVRRQSPGDGHAE
jgi:hypothetical protein